MNIIYEQMNIIYMYMCIYSAYIYIYKHIQMFFITEGERKQMWKKY